MHGFREDLNAGRICTEQALTTEVTNFTQQACGLKRAYMLKNVLENMSIYIEDQNCSPQIERQWVCPHIPEYAMDWVMRTGYL